LSLWLEFWRYPLSLTLTPTPTRCPSQAGSHSSDANVRDARSCARTVLGQCERSPSWILSDSVGCSPRESPGGGSLLERGSASTIQNEANRPSPTVCREPLLFGPPSLYPFLVWLFSPSLPFSFVAFILGARGTELTHGNSDSILAFQGVSLHDGAL
jgi:hypothetical protein